MSNWHRLNHLTACTIHGPDAEAFCQSQFTADIAAIPEARWQVTAWCNRKGRVRAVILAARFPDRVEIVLPASQIGICRELAPYTIGRQVELEPGKSVSGSLDPDSAATRIGGRPALGLRVDQDQPAPAPGDEWIHRWRLSELRLGLPWLNDRSQDRFLPQALGLEGNGGLSYSKGCYPGQEVVARVHYLGKAPEKMVGLLVEAGSNPLPEDLAGLSSRDARGKTVSLLCGVESGDRWIALAVGSSALQPGEEVRIPVAGNAVSGQVTPVDSLC